MKDQIFCLDCGKQASAEEISFSTFGDKCEDCAKKEELAEVNDIDREEIARLVKEGNTSGILDSEGYRISWSLDIEKFKN